MFLLQKAVDLHVKFNFAAALSILSGWDANGWIHYGELSVCTPHKCRNKTLLFLLEKLELATGVFCYLTVSIAMASIHFSTTIVIFNANDDYGKTHSICVLY